MLTLFLSKFEIKNKYKAKFWFDRIIKYGSEACINQLLFFSSSLFFHNLITKII